MSLLSLVLSDGDEAGGTQGLPSPEISVPSQSALGSSGSSLPGPA